MTEATTKTAETTTTHRRHRGRGRDAKPSVALEHARSVEPESSAEVFGLSPRAAVMLDEWFEYLAEEQIREGAARELGFWDAERQGLPTVSEITPARIVARLEPEISDADFDELLASVGYERA